MSDRIRSLTFFTALLFAAACGGGAEPANGSSAGTPAPVTPTATSTTPVVAAPAGPVCGNGKIEGNEMCDGMDLGGKTCAVLSPGSTGTLRCGTGCKFDTIVCMSGMASAPMGGAGAAQGGSGARTMGSAGAGGSGRM